MGEKITPPKPATKEYLNTVRVRRMGDFWFPVEVEVEFEDGENMREKWDGKDAWVGIPL